MKKFIAKLLSLAMCLGLLAACAAEEQKPTLGPITLEDGNSTQSSESTDLPAPEEPFVYCWVRSGEETSMNPHQANATSDSDVLAKMQASLYTYLPAKDGMSARLVPDLAASEPVSEDGVVQGKRTGTVRVTATAANGVKASAKIKVKVNTIMIF